MVKTQANTRARDITNVVTNNKNNYHMDKDINQVCLIITAAHHAVSLEREPASTAQLACDCWFGTIRFGFIWMFRFSSISTIF